MASFSVHNLPTSEVSTLQLRESPFQLRKDTYYNLSINDLVNTTSPVHALLHSRMPFLRFLQPSILLISVLLCLSVFC